MLLKSQRRQKTFFLIYGCFCLFLKKAFFLPISSNITCTLNKQINGKLCLLYLLELPRLQGTERPLELTQTRKSVANAVGCFVNSEMRTGVGLPQLPSGILSAFPFGSHPRVCLTSLPGPELFLALDSTEQEHSCPQPPGLYGLQSRNPRRTCFSLSLLYVNFGPKLCFIMLGGQRGGSTGRENNAAHCSFIQYEKPFERRRN